MSTDPIGNAIWAKINEWFDFNGNVIGAKTGNPLSIGVTATYDTGLFGLELAQGSLGAENLVGGSVTPTLASTMCIGAWLNYVGTTNDSTFLSISRGFTGQNEALSIKSDTAGNFSVGSWNTSGQANSVASPGRNFKYYPITVRVKDSTAPQQVALSPQLIAIGGYAPQLGRYFVGAQWNLGVLEVWVNGQLMGTAAVPAPSATACPYFQVGNQWGPSSIPCGVCSTFYSTGNVLTADEWVWLYNNGHGRQASDLSP